jgi:pimeloyl-ACP methyl ester carboxylesterase
VAYASHQGYPTLAIDRLGNGDSDHPDPILVVQMPAHAEIAHGVVQLAKAGTSPLPRAFDKVIYVGHSFGSLIGNLMNEKYPDAVDATVLTGWSDNFVIAGIPIALGLVTLPAPEVDRRSLATSPWATLRSHQSLETSRPSSTRETTIPLSKA